MHGIRVTLIDSRTCLHAIIPRPLDSEALMYHGLRSLDEKLFSPVEVTKK